MNIFWAENASRVIFVAKKVDVKVRSFRSSKKWFGEMERQTIRFCKIAKLHLEFLTSHFQIRDQRPFVQCLPDVFSYSLG